MLLSSTTFSTLHNGLHYNNNVNIDKHIIKQHILNGGLKIELTSDYLLPIFYFEPFKDNIPDRTNIEQALSSIAFQMRNKHMDIFINLDVRLKMRKRANDTSGEEKAIKDDLGMQHDYAQEKNGDFFYTTMYLKELENHVPKVLEIVKELRKSNQKYEDVFGYRNLVEESYARTLNQIPQRLENKEYFIKPYTSNDDWIFDIFSKVYKTAKASVRNSFCFTPMLYGFNYNLNEKGNVEVSFKPNNINKEYTDLQEKKLTKALNEDLIILAGQYEQKRKEEGLTETEFYNKLYTELYYKFGMNFYQTNYCRVILESLEDK